MQQETKSISTGYRADIDGLRAVAVLAVVIYHAFPSTLKGGFVGVDIFFVISGFLISSIIFSDLRKDAFSFTDFYRRRVRRIFPALIIVLTACFIFGYFTLLDFEYKSLGKHIAGGAGFISNLLLWQESGYFDAASTTKPLLHLWSLGIEEQFYLTWPLLLWAAWRGRKNYFPLICLMVVVLTAMFLITLQMGPIVGHRRVLLELILSAAAAYLLFFRASPLDHGYRVFGTIGVLVVSSFAANIWTIDVGDLSADFYSPVTRFWELLVGAGLAYTRVFDIRPRLHFPSNLQSALGAALITLAFAMVTAEDSFPGWWALLPAMGAFFILSAGPYAWFNRKILSNRLLVSIGLISYPLYLWHWPLLSFSRILLSDAPSFQMRLIEVASSFLLAILTYIFVEKPLRLGKFQSYKTIALVVLAGVLVLAGLDCYSQAGFPARFPAAKAADRIAGIFNTDLPFSLHNAACENRFPEFKEFSECRISASAAPDIVLLGDSHSGMYYDALASSLRDHVVMNLGEHACLPFASKVMHDSPVCIRRTQLAMDFLLRERSIKDVILVGYWAYLASGGFQDGGTRWRVARSAVSRSDALAFQTNAKSFLSALGSANKRIYIFEDTPDLTFNVSSCFHLRPIEAFEAIQSPCAVSKASYDHRSAAADDLLKGSIASYPNVRLYNPRPLFCDKTLCWATRGGLPLYWDGDHLTQYGADMVIADFIEKTRIR